MPERMPRHLQRLLRRISRSFYLTLRMLPGRIRTQIGLAYLLARATDTIADTRLVSAERRLEALRALCGAVVDAAEGRQAHLPGLAASGVDGTAAEGTLLESIPELLRVLGALSRDDRLLIAGVLRTIASGQEMDVERFGSASGTGIAALRNAAELDDYIYRVAGCVGEFWTRMCRAHLFGKTGPDDGFLLAAGIRFGKGLQLVNILRDIAVDLRRGRCYVPLDRLAECGLTPEALLQANSMAGFRPVYDACLQEARDHLDAGWAYVNALPKTPARLRLACAWPILIGVRTIALLRLRNVLDERERIKIGRGGVWTLMLRSTLSYPIPSIWRRLPEKQRQSSKTLSPAGDQFAPRRNRRNCSR